MNSGSERVLLYAPNVHVGGGFVLLQALLDSWPTDQRLYAWLDVRSQARLRIPPDHEVVWVQPYVSSRLAAEFSLRSVSTANDIVLCFHGLPTLLENPGNLVVFLQNRLLFGTYPLSGYNWRTKLRIKMEQLISYALRGRVNKYVVQTDSMSRALRDWYGSNGNHVNVEVSPFVPPIMVPEHGQEKDWDFVYVADGGAHKNHKTLLESWIHLAQSGIRPSLALTLSDRDKHLWDSISEACKRHNMQISNLGAISHEEVLRLYTRARALVYPSFSESFGLPLIEARMAGLPILAGELDFVRDVCVPVETFDSASHVSIARAVRRYLGTVDLQAPLTSATSFLRTCTKPNH